VSHREGCLRRAAKEKISSAVDSAMQRKADYEAAHGPCRYTEGQSCVYTDGDGATVRAPLPSPPALLSVRYAVYTELVAYRQRAVYHTIPTLPYPALRPGL
jgi:hypothetical protein